MIVLSSGAVHAGDSGGVIFKAIRLNKIIYGDKKAGEPSPETINVQKAGSEEKP